MKKISPLLLLTCWFIWAKAQQNVQLVSHLDFVSLANDIWGYTAPDGTEYALVGLRSGVAIVSLADPENPVELHYIPGEQSAWRDIKTWGHHAYVTTDQSGTKEGILVIDLSGLPDSVNAYNWRPYIDDLADSLFTCHNLWIDEFGYAYLSGCNVNSGGVVFLDVFSQPGSPQYAGKSSPEYSHDAYARSNILYSAEIFDGQFSIFDVADKANPVLLATQPTPSRFSHNVWLSGDGKTLFNTDEKGNAPVASFDISDLENIRLLDEFRPPATLGTNVFPHNVHVLDDYLVISHYTDGCVIVDASHPENLVQVGWYDTNTDFTESYHGAWGAYPFFPSGLIAVSDIENGLFILQPEYKRACRLEGTVTDAVTGAALKDVQVSLISDDPNDATTGSDGGYKTGQPTAGTFQVAFKIKGYFDTTVEAVLVNGELTALDVAMTPFPAYEVAGRVVEKDTETPIAGAIVFLENGDFAYTDTTDGSGTFLLPAVLLGEYDVYTGRWGFENAHLEKELVAGNKFLTFGLAQAYVDDFNVDLGWAVSGDATGGVWERGIPHGTDDFGKAANPGEDAPGDFGNRCYVTGNQGLYRHDDDVDGGATLLASPPMQLRSRYNRPVLTFDTWFYNAAAATPADDSLTILIDNGQRKVVLDAGTVPHTWEASPAYDLAKYISITGEMRVIFRTADTKEFGHILEAGVDNFKVSESMPGELFSVKNDLVKIRAFPNPCHSFCTIDYKVEKDFDELSLIITNVQGQLITGIELQNAIGTVQLDLSQLAAAPYFVAFRVDGKLSKGVKVVKGW
ncbi:MAG: choice-of-anchor B family protein [Saprospiraceae bacterium]|nr:MAG: choice-of-anchor B family protein [Saprospiraceae bacterium]